ncbi:hypothetical protein GEMRC1_000816 [Eukaryota sp. GEM-RC1]
MSEQPSSDVPEVQLSSTNAVRRSTRSSRVRKQVRQQDDDDEVEIDEELAKKIREYATLLYTNPKTIVKQDFFKDNRQAIISECQHLRPRTTAGPRCIFVYNSHADENEPLTLQRIFASALMGFKNPSSLIRTTPNIYVKTSADAKFRGYQGQHNIYMEITRKSIPEWKATYINNLCSPLGCFLTCPPYFLPANHLRVIIVSAFSHGEVFSSGQKKTNMQAYSDIRHVDI